MPNITAAKLNIGQQLEIRNILEEEANQLSYPLGNREFEGQHHRIELAIRREIKRLRELAKAVCPYEEE